MTKSTRGKGAIDLKAGGSKIKKNKSLMFRLPGDAWPELDKTIKKHGLRGRQELFDYLIVSGIVFRKAEVLDFLNKEIPKYKELSRQERLSRLGKAERPKGFYWDVENMKSNNMMMYEGDYKAFQDYAIETNFKKQWIYNALFLDGFLGEVPEIIEHVKSCKKRNVNNRKKAVARLTEDVYITVLPAEDAQELLEKNTENYDKRYFAGEIQEYMDQILNKDNDDDLDIEEALNQKAKSLRYKRAGEIRKLTEPVDEDDKDA